MTCTAAYSWTAVTSQCQVVSSAIKVQFRTPRKRAVWCLWKWFWTSTGADSGVVIVTLLCFFSLSSPEVTPAQTCCSVRVVVVVPTSAHFRKIDTKQTISPNCGLKRYWRTLQKWIIAYFTLLQGQKNKSHFAPLLHTVWFSVVFSFAIFLLKLTSAHHTVFDLSRCLSLFCSFETTFSCCFFHFISASTLATTFACQPQWHADMHVWGSRSKELSKIHRNNVCTHCKIV